MLLCICACNVKCVRAFCLWFIMRCCMMCFLRVCVCVCLLFNVFGCRVCELVCDDACWNLCVIVFKCVFNVLVYFVCGLLCDGVLSAGVCFVVMCVCVPCCF